MDKMNNGMDIELELPLLMLVILLPENVELQTFLMPFMVMRSKKLM
jgi:hypothetical protein